MHYHDFLMAISLFPLTAAFKDLKNNEIDVALEIFKVLNIDHCIIVVENLHLMILNHKEVYDGNRFIAHIQKEDVGLFLNNTQPFYMKIGFLINFDGIDVLQDIFQKNSLKVAQFTWLIFANENAGHKLTIPYNCDFLTVELGEQNNYFVKEIYYVKSSGPFVVDFGVWSNTSGLILNDKFDEQRKNMRGAAIIRGDNRGFKICNDFIIEIKHREMWSDYSRMLNFSLVVVDDYLYDDQTDLMKPDGSPCCIGQHSLNFYPDAVFPTCLIPLYMVIKFESDLGAGWKAYFKPFGRDIWLSIFGFLMISVAALMIIGYFTNSIFYINPFAVLYSFCCQDGVDLRNERFTTFSLYIAYLMPFIAATVILPAYSASILAKLTVQLPKVPFTDLETFAQDGTYKLGTINNTFAIKYFLRSEHQLVNQIYHRMFINKEEYPNDHDEAINKLCNDKKFALIPYEMGYLQKYSNCKFIKIEKPILYLFCGFRMRFGSPFKNIFNELLIKFSTSGTAFRIHGVDEVYRMKKAKEDDEFEPIKFSQILPILNLIPLGIFLSIISLMIEIVIRRKRMKNKSHAYVINKRDSDA